MSLRTVIEDLENGRLTIHQGDSALSEPGEVLALLKSAEKVDSFYADMCSRVAQLTRKCCGGGL